MTAVGMHSPHSSPGSDGSGGGGSRKAFAKNLSSLHKAAKKGEASKVKTALSKLELFGPEDREEILSRRDWFNYTALHYAAGEGHTDVVRMLLKAGANVKDASDHGNTALHWAARAGHLNATAVLLDAGADVGAVNSKGRTALHSAADKGWGGVVGELLRRGADPMSLDKEGRTPKDLAKGTPQEMLSRAGGIHPLASSGQGTLGLHAFSGTGDARSVRRELQRLHRIPGGLQEKLSQRDAKGNTCLHIAAFNGQLEIARLLLAAGAAIDEPTENGTTPLHWAAGRGHAALVEALIARGARVSCEASGGVSPLHWAAQYDHPGVCTVLLRAGAPIAINSQGCTPLHWAAGAGNEEVVRVLAAAGGDVSGPNVNGITPLHWAAGEGALGCCTALLELGAEIEARTEDGNTPLHHASREGHVEAARVLLVAGADGAAVNNEGKDPVGVADGRGMREALEAICAATQGTHHPSSGRPDLPRGGLAGAHAPAAELSLADHSDGDEDEEAGGGVGVGAAGVRIAGLGISSPDPSSGGGAEQELSPAEESSPEGRGAFGALPISQPAAARPAAAAAPPEFRAAPAFGALPVEPPRIVRPAEDLPGVRKVAPEPPPVVGGRAAPPAPHLEGVPRSPARVVGYGGGGQPVSPARASWGWGDGPDGGQRSTPARHASNALASPHGAHSSPGGASWGEGGDGALSSPGGQVRPAAFSGSWVAGNAAAPAAAAGAPEPMPASPASPATPSTPPSRVLAGGGGGGGADPGTSWECGLCFQGNENTDACRVCRQPRVESRRRRSQVGRRGSRPAGGGGSPGGGEPGEGDWSCAVCFQGNPPGVQACRICRRPRGEGPRRAAALGQGAGARDAQPAPTRTPSGRAPARETEGLWPCSLCFQQNPPGSDACHVCKRPRGPATPGSKPRRPRAAAEEQASPRGDAKAGGRGDAGQEIWRCAVCFQPNAGGASECRICHRPRGEGPGGAGSGVGSGRAAGWECSLCFRSNPAEAGACKVCRRSRAGARTPPHGEGSAG